MRQFTGALALMIVGVTAVPASAGSWYGGEFSAEVMMTGKDSPANQATGRLFVGKNRIRAEGSHRGQEKAVIIDAANHKAWTLMPASKQYYEGVSDAPVPPEPDVKPLPSDPDSPCNTNAAQVKCTKVGMDNTAGVPAEKWTVTRSVQGRSMQMTMWIDMQRRIIVRQEAQDGPVMERRFKGMEDVGGRAAEKWEFSESFRGQTATYTQWIDARLRVPVRVSGDQKYVLEMRNIQEGPQPDTLFQLPADYQQVAPPKAQQGQGSAMPAANEPVTQAGPPAGHPQNIENRFNTPSGGGIGGGNDRFAPPAGMGNRFPAPPMGNDRFPPR
ncbi:MAG: hypothetical protein H7833_06895 [Magnetococcus sp. DMHC-1]|nr:hypothetical protein [Magnetococcales bacterium]